MLKVMLLYLYIPLYMLFIIVHHKSLNMAVPEWRPTIMNDTKYSSNKPK